MAYLNKQAEIHFYYPSSWTTHISEIPMVWLLWKNLHPRWPMYNCAYVVKAAWQILNITYNTLNTHKPQNCRKNCLWTLENILASQKFHGHLEIPKINNEYPFFYGPIDWPPCMYVIITERQLFANGNSFLGVCVEEKLCQFEYDLQRACTYRAFLLQGGFIEDDD